MLPHRRLELFSAMLTSMKGGGKNSSKNSSKNNNPVQVLVVVLHNPLTGRRNNDPEVK